MRLLALLVAFHSAHLLAEDNNRPAPPDGFAWQDMKAIHGAVLVPDDWHFQETNVEGTLVYRVSKEAVGEDSTNFLTGLTLNVVQNVKEKSKAPPSIYAAKHVLSYITGTRQATEPKVDHVGKLQRITCYCTKKLPGTAADVEFRIRLTTLANDETDTLYVLTFGTPAKDWDANKETGEQLFNPIQIVQSF